MVCYIQALNCVKPTFKFHLLLRTINDELDIGSYKDLRRATEAVKQVSPSDLYQIEVDNFVFLLE